MPLLTTPCTDAGRTPPGGDEVLVAPPILPFDSVTCCPAATLGHAASATIEVVRTTIARPRRAEVFIASANLQQNPGEVSRPQILAQNGGPGQVRLCSYRAPTEGAERCRTARQTRPTPLIFLGWLREPGAEHRVTRVVGQAAPTQPGKLPRGSRGREPGIQVSGVTTMLRSRHLGALDQALGEFAILRRPSRAGRSPECRRTPRLRSRTVPP